VHRATTAHVLQGWYWIVTIANAQTMGSCTTRSRAASETHQGTPGHGPVLDEHDHADWPANGTATSYHRSTGISPTCPTPEREHRFLHKYAGAANSTATITEDPSAIAGRFYGIS